MTGIYDGYISDSLRGILAEIKKLNETLNRHLEKQERESKRGQEPYPEEGK